MSKKDLFIYALCCITSGFILYYILVSMLCLDLNGERADLCFSTWHDMTAHFTLAVVTLAILLGYLKADIE